MCDRIGLAEHWTSIVCISMSVTKTELHLKPILQIDVRINRKFFVI